MTITPRFEFNKYDFGFGILFIRENESKKVKEIYIRNDIRGNGGCIIYGLCNSRR